MVHWTSWEVGELVGISPTKWRKTTEAACAAFILRIQIILQHISPLSEWEVLTTDPWGKQRSHTGQGGFLKPVFACAGSKAIIWSQVVAHFCVSKWRFICINLSPIVCSLHYWALQGAELPHDQACYEPSTSHAGAALPCRVLSTALQLILYLHKSPVSGLCG